MHEITVHHVFSAAHAIRLYDGSLEPLHGHDWRLSVTVAREGLDAIETVMDFHELEAMVQGLIAPWLNANLNDAAPFVGGAINPTAERVVGWLGERLAQQLPGEVRLVSVSVEEAPGCVATYRPG